MPEAITPQGQIPSYDGAVFISYSRADDEKPPGDDNASGWVAFFWEQLRWALTNAGMHQAKLWLDRYEIEPDENFTKKIEEALREARLFIPIFSPNWVQRKYCQEELCRFVELRPQSGDPGDDDIILVKKREVLIDDVPDVLRHRVGYQFFREEPSGKLKEFYWRGLEDREAYLDVLKEMADRIAGRLMVKVKPTPQVPLVAPNGRTVYLAAPADELRDAWRRVANDLRGSGYTVLPSEGRLPDTLPAAEVAVGGALARAELSVHFLGESEGGKPDGSEETLVRLQLRLARERSGSGGRFRRVLWAPKWLPGDGSRRDPFEVVQRFGGLSPGEEVYAEEVTDLSQWLRARLNPPAAASDIAVSTLLIAGAVSADDDLVGRLANRLQSDQINVRPIFAGDPLPTCDDARSAATLVPWEKADRPSLDALLDRLVPLGLSTTVLYLPGDDERAKSRYFRRGVYVERLDTVPADRRAGRELLARLEIWNGAET
jgi:hypothetical protein